MSEVRERVVQVVRYVFCAESVARRRGIAVAVAVAVCRRAM